MLHPLTWVGWLVAASVALSTTRNPLHLILILLCIAIVNVASSSNEDSGRYPVSPLRFALIVIPLSALFNAATVHFGDTVLFRLPKGLPVVGGAITLEALAFGLLNGIVLTGILTVFATLNQALPIRALIRLIPRAFYPVAIVISIGVTFVPVTMRQLQHIREAQAVRGHRVRGIRDWIPLFIPLLIGGLERALQLAEAMTARGFASSDQADHGLAHRAAILMGLIATLGGWLLRLFWGRESLGLALMVTGAILVLAALWIAGRQVRRTTYRPERWTRRDGAVLLVAAVVLLAFAWPGLDRASLAYYPYPALSLPNFAPMFGLATLGLLGPAFMLQAPRKQREPGENTSWTF